MGGVAGGTGTEQFVGIGVDEERVDVVSGFRRAEAAEGGEDDGQEDAFLGDTAGQVLRIFLLGALFEEVSGVGGGGGEVGGEEGAGDFTVKYVEYAC